MLRFPRYRGCHTIIDLQNRGVLSSLQHHGYFGQASHHGSNVVAVYECQPLTSSLDILRHPLFLRLSLANSMLSSCGSTASEINNIILVYLRSHCPVVCTGVRRTHPRSTITIQLIHLRIPVPRTLLRSTLPYPHQPPPDPSSRVSPYATACLRRRACREKISSPVPC